MGKIKQLPPHEAHKIAAGEVVERPASVIKELVENSIDAGATTISIYIQQAGKKLIRIVDNGCGMSEEDAKNSFLHHATSKIHSVDDLSSISSFGFRGEALTSISAVSKVSLITKDADSHTGILLERENNINELSTCAASNGTDISVHDLFYNVPARKKFLKSDQTEWRQIVQLFQAFCLDYPRIHFKLYADDALSYNCPATPDIKQRAHQIFDTAISTSLISLEPYEHNSLKIEGVISNHQVYRYDRGLVFFFVNERWVKNNGLSKAAIKGYLNILPPDRFPVIALKITVDKSEVDINVHPRKEEVAFLHPRIIENAVQESIKKSLSSIFTAAQKPIDSLKKTFFTNNENSESHFFLPQQVSSESKVNLDNFFIHDFKIAAPIIDEIKVTHQPNTHQFESPKAPQGPEVQTHLEEHAQRRLIGTFSQTYLLIEEENGLLLIDQHAAHERILYEQFRNRFGQLPTIALLFPDIIEFADHEMELVVSYKDFFAQHGIILDQISKTHIAVQSIPAHLKNASRKELIKESLALIIEDQGLPKEEFFKKAHEKMHAQMACKAAVKAGDLLSIEQQRELINQLAACENQIACPHGRPTRWLLSTYEIEKKFKRKI